MTVPIAATYDASPVPLSGSSVFARFVRSVVAWLPAALLLGGCEPGPPGRAAALAVHDSAGVAVVVADAEDRSLHPAPRRLGDVISSLAGITVVPWGVAADRQGRVVVVDWSGDLVVARSLDGASLGRLGRPGNGPGEFRSPVAVAADPEGIATVWDAGRGLLSRWDSAGSLLDERRAPVAYFGPGFALLPGGGLAVVTSAASADGLGQRLEVVAEGDRTTLHTVTQATPVATLPCGTMPLPRVFAPSPTWAAHADRVFVRRGPDYRIDTFVGGRLERSLRRGVPPLRPTAAVAAEAARSGPGPHAGLLRRCGVSAEELVRAVGYEDEVSPVMFVAADRRGGLWVTRTRDGVRPGPVDVFEPDGSYRGTVDDLGIPAAFPDDSTVLTILLDSLGTALAAWRWTPGDA